MKKGLIVTMKIRTASFDFLVCLIMILELAFRSSSELNLSNTIIVLLTLLLIIKNHFKIVTGHLPKYLVWYSLVVLICAASLIWAKVNTWSYVYALIKDTYIPFICFLLVAEDYLDRVKSPEGLVNCLIIAELVVIVRAVLNTPWGEMIKTFDSRLFGSGLGRNYNDFTTQMTLVALIVAYMAFYVDKKYKTAFRIIMLFIIISASRKAIVVSVLGYIILYLVSSGTNINKIIKRLITLSVVLLAFLLLIFTNQFLYNLVGEKLVMMFQSLGMSSTDIVSNISASNIDHSMHGRAVLREEAFKQFINNPIFGIGYYNFQYNNQYGLYAHNNFLELLADLGLTGFICYYSLYFCFILSAGRSIARKSKNASYFKFVLLYIVLLVVLEYAQITFFRLFAIIPTIVVFRICDYYIEKKYGGNISEEFR